VYFRRYRMAINADTDFTDARIAAHGFAMETMIILCRTLPWADPIWSMYFSLNTSYTR